MLWLLAQAAYTFIEGCTLINLIVETESQFSNSINRKSSINFKHNSK